MLRAIIILFLILGSIGSTLALEPAMVMLPLLTMVEGQNGEILAEIDCATNECGAFDITVQFDPQVMQVNDITLGPFLGEHVFMAKNMIDNEEGLLRLAATALGNPAETGETVLFTVEVTALNPGASQLRILSLEIGDLIGQPMEITSIDGGVVVSAGVASESAELKTCEYRVRTGDTLFGIALANNVTVNEIIELNDIPNRTIIRVGDTLIIPAEECELSAPVMSGSGNNSTTIEVFDCRHIGSNIFEWYTGQRNFDENGNPISESRVAGPFTGEWQPGCPAGERPSNSSGSGSSGGGGSSSSGGGDDDDDGGLGVCIGPLCL